MVNFRNVTALGIVSLLGIYFVIVLNASGQNIEINGWTFNSQDNGLEGVTVTAYHGAEFLGKSNPTPSSGEYKFSIPEGKTFKLDYTKTGYSTEVVAYLSGSKPHSISKILYKSEEPRPFNAAVATLQSYDSILYFALSLPPELRDQEFANLRQERYSDRIVAIKVSGEIPKGAMQRFYDNRERLVEEFRTIEK